MSKIMQSMTRAARHSRKPMDQRQRYDFSGFSLLALGMRGLVARPYLNGDELEHCLVADEIKGYVEVYQEPLCFDPDAGKFITIKKRGIVGVEIEAI